MTALCAEVGTSPSLTAVQTIVLPKHHLDKPDDLPKCKDFALVTLRHPSDVSTLLSRWPWRREHESQDDDVPLVVREAAKYGFRTISKARWDQLNTEYLWWRQQLLDDMNATEQKAFIPEPPEADPRLVPDTEPSARAGDATLRHQDPLAPYPSGCLVHVRHIHPETNKTTLRKLLGRAFSQDGTQAANGIDYVDFNKGMDTVSTVVSC